MAKYIHEGHETEWLDCDKSGHEEGCYILHCLTCSLYDYDCELAK
jgi:hypothetical protein